MDTPGTAMHAESVPISQLFGSLSTDAASLFRNGISPKYNLSSGVFGYKAVKQGIIHIGARIEVAQISPKSRKTPPLSYDIKHYLSVIQRISIKEQRKGLHSRQGFWQTKA